jgi:hypothetical protein
VAAKVVIDTEFVVERGLLLQVGVRDGAAKVAGVQFLQRRKAGLAATEVWNTVRSAGA